VRAGVSVMVARCSLEIGAIEEDDGNAIPTQEPLRSALSQGAGGTRQNAIEIGGHTRMTRDLADTAEKRKTSSNAEGLRSLQSRTAGTLSHTFYQS